MNTEELQKILDVPFKIWFCPRCPREKCRVEWHGDDARCLTCGMTRIKHMQDLIREHLGKQQTLRRMVEWAIRAMESFDPATSTKAPLMAACEGLRCNLRAMDDGNTAAAPIEPDPWTLSVVKQPDGTVKPWPCPRCGQGKVYYTDIGELSDLRYKCRGCNNTWVSEGADA